LTRLLQEAKTGRTKAAEELFSLVYSELREIAKRNMAQERPGHTLQATALVHEAYLRIVGDGELVCDNRAHFFHVSAEAMRRILIEHARSRGCEKRGGDRRREPISVLDLAAISDPAQILDLDDALRRLEEKDARAAEVVRLRFFAGLSTEETAQALELAPRTIKREWEFARTWLHKALGDRST
jgi:RNA polymerase sigma factor (TIGR02999 family)